jgi:hypothetical protein
MMVQLHKISPPASPLSRAERAEVFRTEFGDSYLTEAVITEHAKAVRTGLTGLLDQS